MVLQTELTCINVYICYPRSNAYRSDNQHTLSESITLCCIIVHSELENVPYNVTIG